MLINNHLSMSATKNSSNKEDVISIEQRMLQKKDKEQPTTKPVPEEDKNKEILQKLMFQIVMNDFMTFTFSPDEDQELVKEW
ncbi:hypothetical protein BTJ39_03555 [Izhakiella australiensis]|uniref:PH domain-containing protein n=1 Tax=Izhakiella australiensis TaxID=1926881 RepID=A0A1S8YQ79_9GAMM|nr:hypothetical protein [Izhakiella australiensis]OON41058.1 hypothetical protein BTJ39_03555 [Izhakiella australiensis]